MVEDPIMDARPEAIGIIVKATANGGCRGECIVDNYIPVILAKVVQIKIKVEFVGHAEGLLKSFHLCVLVCTIIINNNNDNSVTAFNFI